MGSAREAGARTQRRCSGSSGPCKPRAARSHAPARSVEPRRALRSPPRRGAVQRGSAPPAARPGRRRSSVRRSPALLGAMLQLRDPEEGGPEDEEAAGAGGAAALLVPGGPEPPFSAAPPRQKLRPLNVRTASRAGRLKEYFVFRVRPGPARLAPGPFAPLSSHVSLSRPPAARHHRAGGQRDPRRRDAHGGRRRGERVAADRVSSAGQPRL